MAAIIIADPVFSINNSFCFTLRGTADFFLHFVRHVLVNCGKKNKNKQEK
jgi:hypothetical protein